MARTGRCQCGDINYALDGEPLMTYACHCKDCQKRTGSAFSMGTIFPLTALTVSGELSSWERTSDAQETNTRMSCAGCGNIIYGVGSATPTIIKLQTGTLDDTRDISPQAHIWTRSAQHWIKLPSDIYQHGSQPENLMEIFNAVMARGQTTNADEQHKE